MEHKKRKFWPEMVLLFLCAVWLLGGISQKEGYHMDELLSFELANAKFNPWIVPTQPQGRLAKFVEQEIDGDTPAETAQNLKETIQDVLQNKGASKLLSYRADVFDSPVWITGKQFRDYITVGAEDAFCYLSVYFNVKDDNHPPLHFMVLHTVSSLFWGQISPLMGCGINLVCVLGIMVLLLYLGQLLGLILGQRESGRLFGFWSAALYGFSAAAMCTTLLIRMYGMLSFFCMALFVIHVKKLYAHRLRLEHAQVTDFGRGNRLLVLVTVCGFWTQYFFLFYCMLLAAVTVVLLWREDRRREVFCYIRSMAGAAVIGLVGFPFAVSDVFSSGRGVEALANLSSGFAGYGIRLKAFGEILVREMGIWIVVVAAVVVISIVVPRGSGDRGIFSKSLACLVLLPAAGYFLLAARMSPYLVDRYIMPVFAFAALTPMLMLSRFRNRKLLLGIMAITLLLQPVLTFRMENPYLYKGYGEQEQISLQYADSPCICVGEGVGYYENLVEFANYDRTLILTPEELEAQPEVICGLTDAVVLLKSGVERDPVCDEMEEAYHMRMTEVLLERGGAHGDEILYFQAMTP